MKEIKIVYIVIICRENLLVIRGIDNPPAKVRR